MTPALQPSDIPNGYREFLEELAGRIARSQTRAALAIFRELVLLYWSIGAEILLREKALRELNSFVLLQRLMEERLPLGERLAR